MDLILLVLVLVLVFCLVGFFVWLLTTRVQMPEGYPRAIQSFVLIVMVIVMVLYVVNRLGGTSLPHFLR